jgi:hypothetical protein
VEPARLLAVRSELGYTDVPALAMRDEPEAVSAEAQHELTEQAHRRADARRRREWERLGPRLWSVLLDLEAALGRDYAGELRALARDAERLDRRVAGRSEKAARSSPLRRSGLAIP